MPPPYVSPPSCFCGPILEFTPPPIPDLGRLCRALQTCQEHLELLKELKNLDKELKELALEAVAPTHNKIPTTPGPQKPVKPKPKSQSVPAFPVTWSQVSRDSSEATAHVCSSEDLNVLEQGEEEEGTHHQRTPSQDRLIKN